MGPNTYSEPRLYSKTDLAANSRFATRLMDFIIEAFRRPDFNDETIWDSKAARFHCIDDMLDMVGDEGVMCVVFDLDEQIVADGDHQIKIAACAAALPWTGGYVAVSRGFDLGEQGWEFKTVCVDGHPKYAGLGLALRAMARLETWCIGREQEKLIESKDDEAKSQRSTNRHIDIWVECTEGIKASYWRKRSFKEVRRDEASVGMWSSKRPFHIVILKREVEPQR